MGLQGIAPEPKTTVRVVGHKVYPYLLRDVEITRSNQVWACDITYVPMQQSYLNLTAIMDWYSHYVLAWQLSNSMDVAFCVEVLEETLWQGRPEIFNTDHGSQFTSQEFTKRLAAEPSDISMDGKARAIDNVMTERLWRMVKHKNIHLSACRTSLWRLLGKGCSGKAIPWASCAAQPRDRLKKLALRSTRQKPMVIKD